MPGIPYGVATKAEQTTIQHIGKRLTRHYGGNHPVAIGSQPLTQVVIR